ncbi:MAG: ABC transporter permease subunit [Chloroflexia bacterium]|nr:ABC transporter permease subunit [Chloroflexia bacterium]
MMEANPDISAPNLVWLQNFRDVLTNQLALPGYDFWYMLSFNLIWTFVNVFFHVALGVAFAMLLNVKNLRFKRFYRALYIIPWALPALISGMVWRNMYDTDFGAVNLLFKFDVDWINETTEPFQKWFGGAFFADLLDRLAANSSLLYYLIAFAVVGLIVAIFALLRRIDPGTGLRVTILGGIVLLGVTTLLMIGWNMTYSFYAVLLANIWLGWPFMMTVATGALQGIPNELYEAARIDGASGWQSFWQITMPLLRPALVPAIVVGMMMTFNQFNVIYFVTGGNPLHRTEILVTQAFRLVNEQRLYGVAASFSIIVFIVLAVITMITNRVSRATESYAA